jgi:hypothetical protein
MDKNVKIELSVDHINVILFALSKLPLETSMATFMELKKQADFQIELKKPEGPLSDKVIN